MGIHITFGIFGTANDFVFELVWPVFLGDDRLRGVTKAAWAGVEVEVEAFTISDPEWLKTKSMNVEFSFISFE